MLFRHLSWLKPEENIDFYAIFVMKLIFSWCSWLSHQSNTMKVSSSNLDENKSSLENLILQHQLPEGLLVKVSFAVWFTLVWFLHGHPQFS
jgi:hypothetical protein